MTLNLGKQIGRFGIVGIFVVALDYAVFAALLWAMPGNHLLANVAGKIAGAVSGFVLHRQITFAGQHRGRAGRQVLSYTMLFAFNLAMSSLLLWLLVDYLRFNTYWSRLSVDAMVIICSFTGSRLWVYRAV